MKKTLLTICLVWMCFSLSAQKIIDLSGKWSFSIDRQDNGEKEKWFSHTLNGNHAKTKALAKPIAGAFAC